MKHIQTFEGFIGLNEAGDLDSGMAGLINNMIGLKQGRLVISGDGVEELKDRIVTAVLKVDKDARVEFFPKTGKMVGVMAIARLKDLQRELRKIRVGLEAEIKAQRLA